MFQADVDRVLHKRSIYTALDFLGDVGGLKEALIQHCYLFLFLCGQTGVLSLYVVRSIFKEPAADTRQIPASLLGKTQQLPARTDVLAAKQIVDLRPCAQTVSKNHWLRLCGLCRPEWRRRRRLQGEGEDVVSEHLDVVHFIRQQIHA